MDRGQWQHLIALDREFRRRDEIFSRNKIRETMGCSTAQARLYDWGLKHKDIIQLKVQNDNSFVGQKVFLICDIHIPFHDQIAVDAALGYADEYKPDTIVIDGDMMDFYKCSRFTKKTGKHDIKGELKMGREFLTDLRKRHPKAKMIFKEGNHESHLERYVLENAVEIADLVDDLLINKLDLSALDIEYRKDFFSIGKLWYLHGHEKPTGGNADYVTNVMFKYVLDHCIFGHHHRVQEKIFKRIDGSTLWVGAVGYLGGPMDYAPLNNWSQGFATVDYGRNGTFHAKLFKIQGGEIY